MVSILAHIGKNTCRLVDDDGTEIPYNFVFIFCPSEHFSPLAWLAPHILQPT
jgi:hypothetical protein